MTVITNTTKDLDIHDSLNAKSGWEVINSRKEVYTGGKFEFTPDGKLMVCMCSDNIAVVYTETGKIRYKLNKEVDTNKQDESVASERFTAFAIHPTGNYVTTSGDSNLIRHWKLDSNAPTLTKFWKGHNTPVLCASYHQLGDLLATGGSDATVKIWSVSGGYCTHNFRGHSATISSLAFHPNPHCLHVFSGDSAGGLRLWSLLEGKASSSLDQVYKKFSNKHAIFQTHLSAITAIAFDNAGELMFSAGRDKILAVWSLKDNRNKLLKTFPLYESIELMTAIALKNEPGTSLVVTGGDKGIVRLWKHIITEDRHQCTCVKSEEPSTGNDAILGGVYCASLRQLVYTTVDNYLKFINLDSLEEKKIIVGYNDDIIDLQFIKDDKSESTTQQRIAMVTNSNQLQLVDIETSGSEILNGHTDMIIALDVSTDGRFIATGSRDTTTRIWDASSKQCISICKGHTESVTGVAFANTSSLRLNPRNQSKGLPILVSVSSDRTIKLWTNSAKRKTDVVSVEYLTSLQTKVAHDKLINAVAISPNKLFVATASKDKLVKLWRLQESELITVFKGHRRSVWSVEFSPVEKCLASSSADKTIRIWSVSDFSCISILEGHEGSVLRVRFFPDGAHIISGASNGVLKLWSLKKSECMDTLEHHTDRVWAISISSDGMRMVTGGESGELTVWEDHTEEISLKRKEAEEAEILKEQELAKLERESKFIDAAKKALEINRPHRLKTILKKVLGSANAEKDLRSLVESLSQSEIDKCWTMVKEWNTIASSAEISQYLISALLRSKAKGVLANPTGVDKFVKPLLAYNERHKRRLERAIESTYLLDHLLVCMKQNTEK